jgi:hypothetical protein
MKNSIKEALKELNKNSSKNIISDEDFTKAKEEINKKMEQFSIEQKAYFAESIESARKAYLTF